MGSVEKVEAYMLGDHGEAWRVLLANNQYELVTRCVEEAYLQATVEGATEQAALLAAARHLCASCVQIQNEVSFHQRAYQHSERRREKLAAELEKLLKMVELDPETAVPTPKPTLWQRVQHFFHRKNLPPTLTEDPPAIEEIVPPPVQKIAEPAPVIIPETTPLPVQTNDKLQVPQLTVYCLGNFRVFEDEHPVLEWPSRKGKSIFKYLLLHRRQHVTKDVLMAEFWPDATADAARNNLNVAIYGLRQALRNGYPDFSHVLYQNDRYFLNPEMDIWLDCEAFETAFNHACQLKKQGEVEYSLQEFHAAEELYQGQLLGEDPYDEWPVILRQQLEMKYIQLLTHLGSHYFVVEQYPTCILFANKLLQVEPCHEPTHRLLMRAYARQRQSYLALRQYHQCVEQLNDELEIEPDAETIGLFETIRDQQPI